MEFPPPPHFTHTFRETDSWSKVIETLLSYTGRSTPDFESVNVVVTALNAVGYTVNPRYNALVSLAGQPRFGSKTHCLIIYLHVLFCSVFSFSWVDRGLTRHPWATKPTLSCVDPNSLRDPGRVAP
jgi:hypothetical protein